MLEAAPLCVALQFMAKHSVQAEKKKELLDQITSIDIDHEEIIEYTEKIKELADILFYCSK